MRIHSVLLFLILASCSVSKNQLTGYESELSKMSDAQVSHAYEIICSNLEKSRAHFAAELKSCTTETQKKTVYANARQLLFVTMKDSMFPCWYGTEWDYNGVSTTPRSGNVACGYFVTTLVEQAGFQIERTKLAQCASESMIRTLCPAKNVKVFTHNDVAGVKTHLLSKPDGIFIVGLDNHTGFIVKKDSSLKFVHSNYTVVADGVIGQDFDHADAIQQNNYFAVGEFLGSDSTIIKWINGTVYKY